MSKLCLVMIAGAVLITGVVGAQVPAAERAALLALYDATGGAGWVDADGWLGAAGSECGWHGVSCAGGRVTGLDLGANGLLGELPASLTDLTGLTTLDLSYNGVWATAPALGAFLAALAPGWDATQTVAPADLAVTAVTATSATLSWTAPLYTADGGGYIVTATSLADVQLFADGFEAGGTGAWSPGPVAKATVEYTVGGLFWGRTYQFEVRMYTSPHAGNPLQVVSAAAFTQGTPAGESLSVELPGGVPLELVLIPAGTFLMGSPVAERGRSDQEDLHQVTLTESFWIGRLEVTQEQWEAVMGTPMSTSCGSYGTGASYPVYCVAWTDIVGVGGFLERLNAHLAATGQVTGLRLPTEAEWERAARGETQTRFSHGDVLGCGDLCEPCAAHDEFMWWCGNNTPFGNKPVATKEANPYGAYDLHGGVFEWVQDWWLAHLGTAAVVDPSGPASGSFRVLRGGYWNGNAMASRSAERYYFVPWERHPTIGFRLALAAQ